ncbi:hypothetical protein MPH_11230 [Macrophomina phaseolina MS6]|uniref:Uncharacterized protein n=1 Tax=Macrophomina phaseolina (strain MS6) TaxID=1126212 RepID=K2RFS1_MACPH|nr:hypothetical protein MPH_11230 [Macrophomina phaseolina MS6]
MAKGKTPSSDSKKEILKETDGQSIFAWTDKTRPPESLHGILPKSPSNVADSGRIMPYYEVVVRKPSNTTNRGFRVSLHLTLADTHGDWIAALNCPCPPRYLGFLCMQLRTITTAVMLTTSSGTLP